MTDSEEVARVARGLTKAQRGLVLESEPGGWGREEDATGAELTGSGPWGAAHALVRKGLGDIESDPGSYPSGLYFNNDLGLAVRALLADRGEA